ncbi:MAG: hypothetical protein K6T63_15675, partial [Alicyclobacillus herbarius]
PAAPEAARAPAGDETRDAAVGGAVQNVEQDAARDSIGGAAGVPGQDEYRQDERRQDERGSIFRRTARLTQDAPPKSAGKPDLPASETEELTDDAYRQALRQWSALNKPESAKLPPADEGEEPSSPDEQYRRALRSMMNQKRD